MMKIPILAATVVLTAAALSGCCSCRESTGERVFPRTEITYSSGGGVSGLSTGYTITEDRHVLKWSGNAAEVKKVDTVGQVPEPKYRDMLEDVYNLHPDTIRQMETGNMTVALVITANDVTYRYQWAGLYYRDDAVPENVRPLRNVVWDVLRPYYEEASRQ